MMNASPADRERQLAEAEEKIIAQMQLLQRLVTDRESTGRINMEESFLNRLFVRYYTIRREMDRGRRLDLDGFAGCAR